VANRKEKPEYKLVHEGRECSEPSCDNWITHYMKGPDFDGRVWCRRHAYRARGKRSRRGE
jgi:hypothetical protein